MRASLNAIRAAKAQRSTHNAKRVPITLAKSAAEIVEETKPKGGRPSTTGKPWEAEGISRQAWYKRQKKKKPE